jgi:small subunit ribosomal protein S21
MGMGVRIVLADKEPIGLALRRFKKLLERDLWYRATRRRLYFISATQVRRAKRFKKRFKARHATLLAQVGGEQPISSLAKARATFGKRTGKF